VVGIQTVKGTAKGTLGNGICHQGASAGPYRKMSSKSIARQRPAANAAVARMVMTTR
jgi:hypothetical protein